MEQGFDLAPVKEIIRAEQHDSSVRHDARFVVEDKGAGQDANIVAILVHGEEGT